MKQKLLIASALILLSSCSSVKPIKDPQRDLSSVVSESLNEFEKRQVLDFLSDYHFQCRGEGFTLSFKGAYNHFDFENMSYDEKLGKKTKPEWRYRIKEFDVELISKTIHKAFSKEEQDFYRVTALLRENNERQTREVHEFFIPSPLPNELGSKEKIMSRRQWLSELRGYWGDCLASKK
jgi:hypothetical protein